MQNGKIVSLKGVEKQKLILIQTAFLFEFFQTKLKDNNNHLSSL